MDTYRSEHYEAALAALELDPATTTSVYIAADWIRVEHTDRPATSIPMFVPPDPAAAAAPAADPD